MRILFLTIQGEWLPVAYRLRAMGIDARVFVMDRRFRCCYWPLIKLVDDKQLRQAAAESETIVTDLNCGGRDLEHLRQMHGNVIQMREWVSDFWIHQNQYLMDGDLGPRVPAQGTMIQYQLAGEQLMSRVTCDVVFCMLSLMADPADAFASGVRNYSDLYCCSQRISLPPYPYTDPQLLEMAAEPELQLDFEDRDFWGLDIYRGPDGAYRCSGGDGLVGIVTGSGATPGEAWGRCYSNIRKIKVIGARLQYRKDGLRNATRRRTEVGSSN